jgi:ABC-type iron transport system FetAB permease component
MLIAYLILLLAVVAWKGYYAWLRGRKTWLRDRRDHDSLREYLLANGATPWQSVRPFWRHALQRAFRPMLAQWKLWAVVLSLGVIVLLLRSC